MCQTLSKYSFLQILYLDEYLYQIIFKIIFVFQRSIPHSQIARPCSQTAKKSFQKYNFWHLFVDAPVGTNHLESQNLSLCAHLLWFLLNWVLSERFREYHINVSQRIDIKDRKNINF